jgi:hypothetical protein
MGMGGTGDGFGAAVPSRSTTGLRADSLELDPADKYGAMLLPQGVATNQKLCLARALLEVTLREVSWVGFSSSSSLHFQLRPACGFGGVREACVIAFCVCV